MLINILSCVAQPIKRSCSFITDGDSLDSIHFILGGSNELQINPGSCEDTFDDSQQTWSNSPDEDATERVAEGITEPPNIKDSNWSRHQTQQPLQMINQSQPR